MNNQSIHAGGFAAAFALGLLASGSAIAQQFSAWSTPMNMGPPMDLGKGVNGNRPTGDPSLFIDPQSGIATLYFARLDKANQDDWNIYQSLRAPDGTWGDAIPAAELNTPHRETRPKVRRDGLEILFTSERPGPVGGRDVRTMTPPTQRHDG